MSLPIFKNNDRDFQLMQTGWASQLNPLLANPLVNGVFVKSQPLTMGATVVNHRLGRKPQGWMITDINGAATVYRSKPFTELVLVLTSSAAVTVDIWVF